MRPREVTFKLGDVTNVRPTEGIDRLIRVTNHSQVSRLQNLTSALIKVCVVIRQRPGELTNQRVLRMVGVLILINQEVAEALLISGPNLRVSPKQSNGFRDQIIKVKGVVAKQLTLISLEHLGNDSLFWV